MHQENNLVVGILLLENFYSKIFSILSLPFRQEFVVNYTETTELNSEEKRKQIFINGFIPIPEEFHFETSKC